MKAVDPNDVIALLEDGPHKSADLAMWMELPHFAMSQALVRLAAQGVVELHGRGKASRWSLPGTDRRFDGTSDSPTSVEAQKPEPAAVTSRHVCRVEDEEFEIVWNGVGPLPGAGTASGLGSTLSGGGFHVSKR